MLFRSYAWPAHSTHRQPMVQQCRGTTSTRTAGLQCRQRRRPGAAVRLPPRPVQASSSKDCCIRCMNSAPATPTVTTTCRCIQAHSPTPCGLWPALVQHLRCIQEPLDGGHSRRPSLFPCNPFPVIAGKIAAPCPPDQGAPTYSHCCCCLPGELTALASPPPTHPHSS